MAAQLRAEPLGWPPGNGVSLADGVTAMAAADAMELAQFLQLLDDWLAAGQSPAGQSLACLTTRLTWLNGRWVRV